MKYIAVIVLSLSLMACQAEESTNTTEELLHYNILSLDGGGIRGLITAVVVDYMEKYSYEYALSNYCIPERGQAKVSMAELFDMVSGTSTGSLLATAIVMPNANYSNSTNDTNSTDYYKNRYWAQDCIEIYTEKGSTVFTTYTLGFGYQLLGAAIFGIVGGLICFWIGICVYHNHHHEETMEAFSQYIKSRKSIKKGKGDAKVDTQLGESLSKKMENAMQINLLKATVDNGDYDQIKKVEEEIMNRHLNYSEKKGRKWFALVAGFFFFGICGYIAMPYLHMMSHSGYDRKGIESITLEMFGYSKITDALTDEVVIVSYDYNNHQPKIFSKFTANNYGPDYDVLIKDAAEASSAAPFYFDPKVIRGQVLIDGGVIANSPSLYSYLHAKFINKKSKVRLISIGTGTTQPTQLNPEDITKVTWLTEISSLITTVEQNTHDYLNQDLIGSSYYRFQSLMNESLSLDAISDEDLAKLISYGNQVVETRKSDVHKVCEDLVDDKMIKIGLTKCI